MRTIRPAADGDLARLRDIESAAGALFATVGMHAVAEDDPPSEEELRAYVETGRAWVAVEPAEDGLRHDVAGYLVASVVDGHAHIDQVSVHPRWARRGIGRGLVEHAATWGRAEGRAAVTLTTFTEVPWNGPYYERLGFRYLADAELGPELAAIRGLEAARGLDAWPRAAMLRAL